MATFQTQYNSAIAKKYSDEISRLIRQYFSYVSDKAIEAYLITGDFSSLASEEMLTSANLYINELQPKIQQITNKFLLGVETKTNAQFIRCYKQAGKPIPAELKTYRLNKTQQNLLTMQQQEITDLMNWQSKRIIKYLQQNAVQDVSITQFKKFLKEQKIPDKQIDKLAKNQLRYTTSAIDQSKAVSLGLNMAKWHHIQNYSVYKTRPRRSHVEADGEIFDLGKGCKIDGKYILPGQEPYCLCFFTIEI